MFLLKDRDFLYKDEFFPYKGISLKYFLKK